jgi:hypothetical protein
MKKYSKLFVVVLSTLAATSALSFPQVAQATLSGSEVSADRLDPKSFSWDELKQLVLNCAVQPISKLATGETEFHPLVSLCPKNLSVHGSVAQFRLKGLRYVATLFDSPLADEGDLNSLVIRDEQGRLTAQAEHIAAFGDILLALAGGDDTFRQIPVDPQTH